MSARTRSWPVGKVTGLRAGDRLRYVCKCGGDLGVYYVEAVTEKTAVVSGGRHNTTSWRIKRRDIHLTNTGSGDRFVFLGGGPASGQPPAGPQIPPSDLP